jgi:AraC-like DNA-binding protein/ligand-binding sensor protein
MSAIKTSEILSVTTNYSTANYGMQAIHCNEVNIINRRELEPLLENARQVLKHYNEATGCFAAVLDRTGAVIKNHEYKRMKFCEFCKKNWNRASQIQPIQSNDGNCAGKSEEIEYPCQRIHLKALEDSKHTDDIHIYPCAVGFLYWTGPLYRNSRYAGALIAGPVIPQNRKESVEKFRVLCDNEKAQKKFARIIEEIPEKTYDNIKAMAQILKICADKISGKREDYGEMIHSITRQAGDVKKSGKQPQISRKNERPSHAAAGKRQNDSEYLPEQERRLLAAFRRGDNDTGSKILGELMESICATIPGNFEVIRFRAIELVVLLSRAAAEKTARNDTLLETNNRYLKRIQDSETSEELISNLRQAAECLAGKLFSFQGIRHASVLRRAERYIWDNYTRKVSLEEIAKTSGLSAPYFSTTFKEEMGENLSRYLNRLRIERAASLLTETGKSLNEIAGLCGFEDQSWFSKLFKSFTGMSPGKYREKGSILLS